MTNLNGKKIAILVAEGFEQVELTDPRKALDTAGASTSIVSPAKGEVQGWKHFDKADELLFSRARQSDAHRAGSLRAGAGFRAGQRR